MKKILLPILFASIIFPPIGKANYHPIVINNDDSIRIIIGDTIRITEKNKDGKEGKDVEIIINDLESAIEEIQKISNRRKQEDKHLNGKTMPADNQAKISKKRSKFKTDILMMDVGLNNIIDNTNYRDPQVQNFLRVDDNLKNEKLFNLENWSSRNINLWPILFSYKAVDASQQRLLVTSGFGLQFYSFKYANSLQLNGGMDPHFTLTDVNYSKNKLGITYLSIPVMLTGQTKMNKSKWLTYGVGVIGGYKLQSWTKQKSSAHGKVKDKDPYALNPFQLSLTGEFGIKGLIRFYATYQLTNMWDERSSNMINAGLQQQPFAIGIRFFGI